MPQRNPHKLLPLLVAVGIVIGIAIGSFYANHFRSGRLNIINTSSNKLSDLLHLVDDQYVDKVDISDLVEKSLPKILRELDPHSVYISAADAETSMQELKGSFSGIGIQFNTFADTIHVMHVIKGGPSEGTGLAAGDRIIAVGDSSLLELKSKEDATKLLKGPKGSVADLRIVRPGSKKPISIKVTRGNVPVKSIETVYLVDKQTGYIKINSFGDTTYPEFLAALAKLNHLGFEGLIIDLRGNLGGYMAPAVQIANEFLSKNKLIVYTEGRKSPREDYKSDGRGSYQQMPLVILMDESSASASEILAGAIQDNDRGTIVGRRSFGKGLVQVPIEFRDGSMLRLTKARYYTPSGRCLQKPYTPGDEEDYELDLISRAEHGEYFSADSIKTDSINSYKTIAGRTVYGGGGIIPDVFVARDTLGYTSYFKDAYLQGLLHEFGYHYTDTHRKELNEYTELQDLQQHLKRANLVEKFATYAAKKGLKRRNNMIRKSHDLLENHLMGYIIDNASDTSAATEFINETDPVVLRALQLFEENATFPKFEKAKKE